MASIGPPDHSITSSARNSSEREREPEAARGFRVDDELELRRLLDRQIAGALAP